MPKITFEGTLPIEHEALLANVAHAKSLGLPYFRESEPHGRTLAVVGGGPSIVDHIEEIRAHSDIWAINGACGFLREHGIESRVFSLDPFPLVAPRVAGAKKGLLCSRCDPLVFETLKDAEIELFDVMHEEPGGIWASCSTVLATFHLATLQGYRQTVFYGCEGSYSDTTHAYMDEVELQDYRFVVECAGVEYLTAPDLYMQTQQMAQFLRLAINDSFTERSGGLLRAMVANPEHEIVKVSRALAAGLKPIVTLVKGFDLVHVGFRPKAVQAEGKELGWVLISDLPSSPEIYGAPKHWATDGHRIYFDKRADRDYSVTVERLL